MSRPDRTDRPSLRELQIIWLAANGNSNREIGLRLTLAEDTVKTHLRKAFRKLDVRDRAHAVNECWRRGYFPPRRPDRPDTAQELRA